jgi:FtsP/CotA-like multicopper oxidase with cupredoxin domain
MKNFHESRRQFLKVSGLAVGASLLSPANSLANIHTAATTESEIPAAPQESGPADYTLHIKAFAGRDRNQAHRPRHGHCRRVRRAPAKRNGLRRRLSSGSMLVSRHGATAATPDETFKMTFAKDNAAEEGFNRWTINDMAYPMTNEMQPATFHLKESKRYGLRMRNVSDDIHPIHLHGHNFELTNLAGEPTEGVLKDVVSGGYQAMWILWPTIQA